MKNVLNLILLSILTLFSGYALSETEVNVIGLFTDKAVLIIDNGKPQTLSVGQTSKEGVKLIAADSQKAVVEIEGKRKQLAMGQAASVMGSATKLESATLYADASGHHVTEGFLNNTMVQFLVDTGATTIAMNEIDAKRAGIAYNNEEAILVQTANGNAKAHRVTIATVRIGSLVLHQVDGVVLEGGSPSLVLLGMSALNRLDMKRDGIALTLTKKY